MKQLTDGLARNDQSQLPEKYSSPMFLCNKRKAQKKRSAKAVGRLQCQYIFGRVNARKILGLISCSTYEMVPCPSKPPPVFLE